MGFPVGYTEVFMPKLLLHILSLLGFVRTIVTTVFAHLGLSDFLEPDSSAPVWSGEPTRIPAPRSAVLIRELLPAAKFEEVRDSGEQLPESCAVCLYEFEEGEEIRQLRNCKHVFHKGCIDRWMDQDRDTCPLCRNSFVPNELRDEFEARLWGGLFAAEDDYEDYLLNCELSDAPTL